MQYFIKRDLNFRFFGRLFLYLFSTSSLINCTSLLTVFCLYRQQDKFLYRKIYQFIQRFEQKLKKTLLLSALTPLIGVKIVFKGQGKGKKNKKRKMKF